MYLAFEEPGKVDLWDKPGIWSRGLISGSLMKKTLPPPSYLWRVRCIIHPHRHPERHVRNDER